MHRTSASSILNSSSSLSASTPDVIAPPVSSSVPTTTNNTSIAALLGISSSKANNNNNNSYRRSVRAPPSLADRHAAANRRGAATTSSRRPLHQPPQFHRKNTTSTSNNNNNNHDMLCTSYALIPEGLDPTETDLTETTTTAKSDTEGGAQQYYQDVVTEVSRHATRQTRAYRRHASLDAMAVIPPVIQVDSMIDMLNSATESTMLEEDLPFSRKSMTELLSVEDNTMTTSLVGDVKHGDDDACLRRMPPSNAAKKSVPNNRQDKSSLIPLSELIDRLVQVNTTTRTTNDDDLIHGNLESPNAVTNPSIDSSHELTLRQRLDQSSRQVRQHHHHHSQNNNNNNKMQSSVEEMARILHEINSASTLPSSPTIIEGAKRPSRPRANSSVPSCVSSGATFPRSTHDDDHNINDDSATTTASKPSTLPSHGRPSSAQSLTDDPSLARRRPQQPQRHAPPGMDEATRRYARSVCDDWSDYHRHQSNRRSNGSSSRSHATIGSSSSDEESCSSVWEEECGTSQDGSLPMEALPNDNDQGWFYLDPDVHSCSSSVTWPVVSETLDDDELEAEEMDADLDEILYASSENGGVDWLSSYS